MDLCPRTISILVCFIVVYRSLSIEPSLELLAGFYGFPVTFWGDLPCISCKYAAPGYQLLSPWVEEDQNWWDHAIVLEFSHGWGFHPYPDEIQPRGPAITVRGRPGAERRRIFDLTRVHGVGSQSRWYSGVHILSNEPLLQLCGLSSQPIPAVRPRISLSRGPMYDWGQHGDACTFCFQFQCYMCRRSVPCPWRSGALTPSADEVVVLRRTAREGRAAEMKDLEVLDLPYEDFVVVYSDDDSDDD